jgi:4-azaleucine resistance transporter AzlC
MTTRLRDGARRAVPIAIAVFPFGVSFGLLARSVGMGRVAPIVMSATTFAGSAQFAVASILDAGGTAAAAILAAVLLNVRYAPISISVGGLFGGAAPKRLVQSQLIVDESWALAARGGGRFDRDVLLGAGLLLYPSWVAGTALGVFGAGVLGNPSRLGLDAAFPALFLALLLPQLRGRRALAAAIVAGAIALALVPVVPAGIPIVAASAACLVGWRPR